MADLQIGSARAGAGEVGFGSIPVSELNDGSPIEVPVCVIRGAADGPCLWIQNGVHGDEYVGAAAIGRLIREVDPTRLRGTLVLIPELNIQAFRAGTRMAPQDGLDMNRIWPGAGLDRAWHVYAHSELVVHAVWRKMRANADVVVDLHAGGWQNMMAPWVAYIHDPDSAVCRESERLALATGLDVVWSRPPSFIAERTPGSLLGHLTREGVPSVVLEAGGEGRATAQSVNMMERALLNVAKLCGILPGEPEVPQVPRRVNKGHWVRAAEGGMWRLSTRLMTEVRQGEALGVITDLHGSALQEVAAPAPGIIIGLRTLAVVNSGEYLANVAELV